MNGPVPAHSPLFDGIAPGEVKRLIEATPHRVRRYARDEVIFRLMDEADRVGILLEGRVQAEKSFPNGSQINVSIRTPGEMIGAAAAFSSEGRYPCDIVALEPTAILILRREAVLHLLQSDVRVLENFMREMSSATYMLQQRLELFSYSGIAQKAAFYLLSHARQSGQPQVPIPGSMTRWAMLMNVSRPSLHRELRRMADSGVIRYSPPLIEIQDAQALQDILSR